MRSIAVPSRRALNDAGAGEKIFHTVGCASCHHPSYTIRFDVISPFTDLLLHDMGPGLADRSLGGDVLATEWRTPPLWGIGLFETVNGHRNLLHDGRARGVQEAILWHGGEAQGARSAYLKLSKSERMLLVDFVNSL